MYPNVTQFDTRDRLIRDEIHLRAERKAHGQRPTEARRASLTRRILLKLRFA